MEIYINNASKMIKGNTILNDVNIALHSGYIYGLRGPNGSGKTMLMRLIAGLIRPTKGSVNINGNQLGREMDFPPSMGILIENPAFISYYTGIKNLELLASIRSKISLSDIRSALIRVGLDPDDKRTLRKYSLGMKQRLGIAAAIMEKPDLIILDEPTNALDEGAIFQIVQLLHEERERGALIVITCHDTERLRCICDEIYYICEGCVSKEIQFNNCDV